MNEEDTQLNCGERSMDILYGSLLKELILFALLIAASSILQQLFNSADLLPVLPQTVICRENISRNHLVCF